MKTSSKSILTKESQMLLPELADGELAFVSSSNALYIGVKDVNVKILGESPDSSPINAHEAHYNHANIHAPGSDNQDLSNLVVKETGKSLVPDTEIAKIHAAGSDNQDLSNLVVKVTGKGLSENDLTAALKTSYDGAVTHAASSHAPSNAQKNSDITGAEIEAKLTGAITTHTHAYEPANANIQTHVGSSHAPANAQKNSDITLAEIEAKLTGTITSHTHNNQGYAINVQALTSSPGDGATVYFGTLPKAPVTTGGQSKIYVRAAGTIKRAEIYVYSGTAGTNENWSLYIRVNNSSDTLIATVGANTNERVFSNTSLSISLAAGDYFEIKGVQPTWATNPLTTIYGGYVYIE